MGKTYLEDMMELIKLIVYIIWAFCPFAVTFAHDYFSIVKIMSIFIMTSIMLWDSNKRNDNE